MRRFRPLIVGLILATGSFAYAHHHYVSKNTATMSVGKSNTSFKNPFADKSLFGDWMKDEWLFAIVLPVALLAGGAALSLKK